MKQEVNVCSANIPPASFTISFKNLQSRPLNIADTKGAKPVGLFLGQGPNALEVAVLQSVGQPSAGTLRTIWSSRLAGRATPLLIVVLHGNSAAPAVPAEINRPLSRFSTLTWLSASAAPHLPNLIATLL